jgi:hypothetical protein
MTNYNERLDKIFAPLIDSPSLTLTTTYWDEAKQAITSLIKELVAEAKPPYKTDTRGATQNPDNAFYHTKKAQGYNEAIDQFEQNLLKALEEV